jgi:alpha-tubulin suppressor-like RCC1 family protein
MRFLRVPAVLLPLTCAALALGSVRCVGDDPVLETPAGDRDGGNAGDAPSNNGDSATPPDGATDDDGGARFPLQGVTSLALGRTHSCALLADQSVACWGNNDSGQLGVLPGVIGQSGTPIRVDLQNKKVKSLVAGAKHTCALTADGTVLCWGNNDKGQLGRSTFSPINAVEPVTLPAALTKPALLAAGGSFTCVGNFDGLFLGAPGEESHSVYCFGENLTRQLSTDVNNGLPVPTPTRLEFEPASPAFTHYTLALGEDFSCGGVHVSPNGSSIFKALQCWGNNAQGQAGAPAATTVVTRAKGSPLYNGNPVAQTLRIAAGKAHACAVVDLASGGKQLLCWGNNTRGQTGDSTAGARPLTAIPSFDASGITSLAAGGEETCFVADGKVKCAGANDNGQLGRGTVGADQNASFLDVTDLTAPTAVAVGGGHACAIVPGPNAKPAAKCWGSNDLGQLGTGAPEAKPRPKPTYVTAAK